MLGIQKNEKFPENMNAPPTLPVGNALALRASRGVHSKMHYVQQLLYGRIPFHVVSLPLINYIIGYKNYFKKGRNVSNFKDFWKITNFKHIIKHPTQWGRYMG